MTREVLTGWGRTAPSAADVVDVSTAIDARAALEAAGARGAVARGLGRAYGDAAQNAGGTVLRFDGGAISLDPASGVVTADAGVSIDQLLRTLVPQGWFVPVTPGTRFVTVGGAVAADIHGKNHHADGSWGDHVIALDMLLADGSTRTLTRDDDADAFWATLGGMGLTGVVLSCRFRAIPIETSRMTVDSFRCADLDETMSRMVEHDARWRYSVAWLDVLATGRAMGRGVVTLADHAPASAHTDSDRLAFAPKPLAAVPVPLPSSTINSLTVRAFNEMWFHKAPRERHGELQTITNYFHPLDMVTDWNRFYGRRGVVQHQFVVPFGAEAVLRTAVERMATVRAPSFLTVLKRFGAANAGHLSFAMPGWTLAVDVPAAPSVAGDLFDELDRLIVDAGGRLYLAKDSRMRPDLLRPMYPRLDDWRAVCARLDPGGVFQSDLSRRLGLRPCTHAASTHARGQ